MAHLRVVGLLFLQWKVRDPEAWRLSISVHPTTKNDFVYGLGNIGLVTHLEVWIGISS